MEENSKSFRVYSGYLRGPSASAQVDVTGYGELVSAVLNKRVWR